MTWFRSDFLYLASKILRILRAELILPSDSRHLSAYVLIKYSSGLTFVFVKCLKSYVIMSNICSDHPLNGPSLHMMMFLENLRSNLKAVSKYLPRIIFYLLLVDLSTSNFHDTILVTQNSGR